MIEWVDRMVPEIQIITTKSYQVRPNPGYREPVVLEQEVGCFANAVGLRNPGMKAGFRELSALRRQYQLRSLLNVSLSANCVEDFIELARCFSEVADILELNFSCPHAASGYGSSIGTDPKVVHQYTKAIRCNTSAILIPKLTPNVENIGEIARAAVSAGADGLSAINTVGPELFLEPSSGKAILSNPNGGTGGKSGEWIKERARECVADIRSAVGPAIPIIGIGGVSSGRDVTKMKQAGADVVGLGSVFARIPRQDLIPLFVGTLVKDCAEAQDRDHEGAAAYLASERLMEYRSARILEIRELSESLRLITLDTDLAAAASQYAFIFLPGVGEKPFSIARNDPTTFLVRKRGPFTSALFQLAAGERILIRGPYGARMPASSNTDIFIVAGGTGIALAPLLIHSLHSQEKEVTLLFGSSREEDTAVLSVLDLSCRTIAVPDRGRPARILGSLSKLLDPQTARASSFYNIGPQGFLARACRRQTILGANASDIFVSLETPSLCGVGLCGSCECGGRLLCKEGTFVSLEHLNNHDLGLDSFPQQRMDEQREIEQPIARKQTLSEKKKAAVL
jgi:dihydroorotate dehydrogenase (NAD+) catalytic subunit